MALTPEYLLLRELLAGEPGWVSGAALASKLGVSRVSVWNRLKKLGQEGFVFEARTARGYRIASRPQGLHAGLIEIELKVRPEGMVLAVLDETDSTNDEVERLLSSGSSTPIVAIARRQLRGRGRFGRPWHSEPNGNLYASFGFKPRATPERMQAFTVWMGLSLCELIENFTKLKPGLKWPNDIVFEGRKAGGMLTEARIDADQIRDLVFGLGLNVNSPAGAWPGELAQRAVSLSELARGPIDLNRFTAALIGRVFLAYTTFAEGKHSESFARLWHRYDVLTGRRIAILEGNSRHPGIVDGVDEQGALLLKDAKGRTRRFRAGEVTIEKTSG